MPIALTDLRTAALRSPARRATSITEARRTGVRTAFLCHSHKDATLAIGLVNRLAEEGCEVYVDWLDEGMPERPNRVTAERIQGKIVELDYFIFLATPNSTSSRWCPWEIGYADGKKSIKSIFVVATTENGLIYGNEYLALYRRIETTTDNSLASFEPGMSNNGAYVRLL